MQSCWVVYTSFPMPSMGSCADLEDQSLDVTTETMSAEAMRYSIILLHDCLLVAQLIVGVSVIGRESYCKGAFFE